MKSLQQRLAFGVSLVACLAATTALADDIPRLVPYQGYLELSGQPVNGTETLLFELLQNGTTIVWSEEQDVTFTEGRFSVFLGEKTAASSRGLQKILARGLDLYLKITIRRTGGDVALDGMQRLAPAPYAMRPAVGAVPVGTVIDWWRATATTAIPDGYVVADGSTISDSESPLNGIATPDLTNRFIRGVTNPGALAANGTGGSGGTTQHSHSVDLPAHDHSVNVDHDHGLLSIHTASAGAHRHEWAWHIWQDPMWYWRTWDSAGNPITLTATGPGIHHDGSGYYPILTGPEPRQLYTDLAPNHYHTVSVDLPNLHLPNRPTSSYNPPAQTTTQSTHLPPYVGLLKLIRVR